MLSDEPPLRFCTSPAIALLNQLRHDADRDFARLIGAELQADRAMKRARPVSCGMPAAASSLSSTARFALLPMTPRNGNLRPWRKISSRIGRSVAWPIVMQTTNASLGNSATSVRGSSQRTFRSRARCRDAVEPFGPRIDARDVAIELAEALDDRARHVAGAEDDDPPVAVVVRFEEQLHRAAAGHADVALEVPFDELGGRRLIGDG